MAASTAILLAACLAGPAGAAPTTSATANAWSAQDTQNGTTIASAGINFSGGGGPGSANATAGAGAGSLSEQAAETACAIAFPPDGQLCNNASANSSFNDIVTISSDAPDGTHVQVLATFSVSGTLSGTGAYIYTSSAIVLSTGMGGANGSSGGVITTVSNAPIAATSSATLDLQTGTSVPVGAAAQVGVSNRCCFGGAEEGWGMSVALGAGLTLTVPSLPPGATYVHIIGSGGHDYGVAPAAVGDMASAPEGLSPAMPNPARGPARLALTLSRDRLVDVGVFDIAGRRVATLARGTLGPGTHPLTWDGRDAQGSMAHGGIYLVRALGEGLRSTQRIVRIE